jgi:hypothetical protein
VLAPKYPNANLLVWVSFLSHSVAPTRRCRQQWNVETVFCSYHVCFFLFLGKQIKQQGSDCGFVEFFGDVLVSGAKSAAAAPMRKQHNPSGASGGKVKVPSTTTLPKGIFISI